MATEEGIITRVENGRAWVLVSKSSMCEGCRSRSACNSLGHESEDRECEALNNAGARVGDMVSISIASGFLLKIAFIFYVIPVLFLIGGAITGARIAPSLGFDPQAASLVSGLTAFLVSFSVIITAGMKLNSKRVRLPRVDRVIRRAVKTNAV
jgi:sigma-E factor negative regulatory protein RseC